MGVRPTRPGSRKLMPGAGLPELTGCPLVSSELGGDLTSTTPPPSHEGLPGPPMERSAAHGAEQLIGDTLNLRVGKAQ
jgi:hypothetical protein